jgi:hypothetical protein
MTDEKKVERAEAVAQSADDRSYEPPALTKLGTVGELTSANEDSASPF